MKTKLIVFLLLTCRAALAADSAFVSVQLYPAVSGRYIFEDKETTDGSILHLADTITSPYFVIGIRWPEADTHRVLSCILTCFVEQEGMLSLNLPVPLERNSSIRILADSRNFYEQLPLPDRMRYHFDGSPLACDFDRFWNKLMALLGDPSGREAFVQKREGYYKDFIGRYPSVGLWKSMLAFDLGTEEDTAVRARLAALVPPGLCDASGRRSLPDSVLCSALQPPRPANDSLVFSLAAPDGRRHSAKELKGKIYVVDFWATWCGPCRKEMPALEAFYREVNSPRVGLVSVSVDRNEKDWKQFVGEHPKPWLQLLDPGGAWALTYGVSDIPTHLLVDEGGRILGRERDLDRLRDRLLELLAED
jgi:thiol-disulfide isomerase/thioredoxin